MKAQKTRHLEFVLLTEEQHVKLCELLGADATARWIDDLNDYLGTIKNKNKYDSHYHVIRQWAKRQKSGASIQESGEDHARQATRFIADLKECSSWPNMPPNIRTIVYAVLLKRRQQWTVVRKALLDDPTIEERLKADFTAEAQRCGENP